MKNDLEKILQQRPRIVQTDEAGGLSIPIDKIYDMLDYLFGWDNWDVVVNRWERTFDKIDVSVSLIVNFGDHKVVKDGTATLVTKTPNKDSERTKVEDMDLPKAVAYATKNAASKYGKKFGRGLNKNAKNNENGDPEVKVAANDNVARALLELTSKIKDINKKPELEDVTVDKSK